MATLPFIESLFIFQRVLRAKIFELRSLEHQEAHVLDGKYFISSIHKTSVIMTLDIILISFHTFHSQANAQI